jgi:hypothetical protein
MPDLEMQFNHVTVLHRLGTRDGEWLPSAAVG